MGLRILEMVIDRQLGDFVSEALKEYETLGLWLYEIDDKLVCARILLASENVEPVMDVLEKNYGSLEEFRTLVLPVEASLPRLKASDRTLSDSVGRLYDLSEQEKHGRVSREELLVMVADASNPSGVYFALVLLSSIVAAIGLLRDNTAIIIGSMVIAPLLGPNMALSLASIIGDKALLTRALKAGILGIGWSLAISLAIGWFLPMDSDLLIRAAETSTSLTDVALALASGTAGALAFTSGLSTALVGVMVAVALLPPLVMTGLLVGMDQMMPATGSALIFVTNLICINLSAIVTFLVQGVRPGPWDEPRAAKKSVGIALVVLILLLTALIVGILYHRTTGSAWQW